MKNQFVSYNMALKIKELGFDEPCFGIWINRGTQVDVMYVAKQDDAWMAEQNEGILAPIWQQVLHWFREKHQIYIEVLTDCTTEHKFCFKISKFVGNTKDLSELEWDWIQHDNVNWSLYYTYEEALEESIKEAIGII